ncbi:MAG: hypothetical protein OEO21_10515 [Candidatus Krumholzibacteria bacterium]|nr:hypothetical protein [Candidatus Krumholzibacteria bacterium]
MSLVYNERHRVAHAHSRVARADARMAERARGCVTGARHSAITSSWYEYCNFTRGANRALRFAGDARPRGSARAAGTVAATRISGDTSAEADEEKIVDRHFFLTALAGTTKIVLTALTSLRCITL